MKLKLTLALLLCAVIQVLGTHAKAQTTLSIDYAFDSTWVYCQTPPTGVNFFVGGTATGYSAPADSFDVHLFFGDGNDTIMTVPYTPNNWYSAYLTHYYNTPGIYTVQYIVTAPDGNADTLVNYNEVFIGMCGNITGRVYNDMNGNCTQDAGEPGIPNMPLQLFYNNQVMQWAWSDANGDYFFSAPTGYNYTISLGSAYGYGVTCPASGTINVSSLPSNGNDFAMSCLNNFDLVAQSWGWGYRPGFAGYVYIIADNYSCNPTNAQLQLTLDPMLNYVSATVPPSSVSGNVITWNMNNMTNTSGTQYIYVTVTTSLSANIGDTLCNLVTINPVSGDNNPANNSEISCLDVRNSWDPNMKLVSPEGVGAGGEVAPNTTFTYTVHFQNTGSDVAYNIYVQDTLDSDLDASTLKVLGSSHPMHMSMYPGNVMKFYFDNIMLDDSTTNESGSHGFVSYQVKAKTGLANGTQVKNTAHIFFDFNPAVVTNTTINTINIALDVNDISNEGVISIAPNPASDIVQLNFTGVKDDAAVQLLDMTGRVIAGSVITAGESTMNVSMLPEGVYMISVKSANGNLQQRLIVVH